MKKEVCLVIGNHRNRWGIEHILEILQRDLLSTFNVQICQFPKSNAVNLFIEEFSSKEYIRNIEASKGTNILIVTEFLSKSKASLKINNFPVFKLAFFAELLKKYRNPILIFRLSKIYIHEALRRKLFFSPGRRYWKSREKGLSYLLDKGYFKSIISLHPSCLENIDVGVQNYTYYPILNNSRKSIRYKNSNLITMGSLNAYRKCMLIDINQSLPMGVIHYSSENLDLEMQKSNATFVDIYLPNSPYWPYTSPIRIVTSLNKGIPVILYKNQDSHPITETIPKIADIREFTLFEEGKIEKFYAEKIRDYNKFAKRNNDEIVSLIRSLL